jgi:hypothetical protein
LPPPQPDNASTTTSAGSSNLTRITGSSVASAAAGRLIA